MCILLTTDPSGSDQFHVVTISDTGRNWSDQEVRALIQVWSDERICRQLESSTRKRDIFIQISNKLMQHGIERDWKQCHTKYKNLKYLYRSLQRGRTEKSDPRLLMRFYEEVDAIMNRTNSSPQTTGHIDYKLDTAQIPTLDDEDDHTAVYLPKVNTVTSISGPTGEQVSASDSVPSVTLDLTANNKEQRTQTSRELCADQQPRPIGETLTGKKKKKKKN